MAYSSSSSQPPYASGYRIKFDRNEFLRILSVANPKRVYRLKDFIYFAYDGFVMYCDQLDDNDLTRYEVLDIIEFSNAAWQKT
ncbi:MAG: hypothetical protein ACXAE3_09905 [Candidatus Kariarchaeaceae archaeon]|jgi:hypothetical protein